MRSEHGSGREARQAGQPPPAWREMLEEVPSIRQVFHALGDMGEGEDATDLPGFAARHESMADLARRAQSVARLDDTIPCEPEYEDLQETLWELYAASRVRDARACQMVCVHDPLAR